MDGKSSVSGPPIRVDDGWFRLGGPTCFFRPEEGAEALERLGFFQFQFAETGHGSGGDGLLLVFGVVGDQHDGDVAETWFRLDGLQYANSIGVIRVEFAIDENKVKRLGAQLLQRVFQEASGLHFRVELRLQEPGQAGVVRAALPDTEYLLRHFLYPMNGFVWADFEMGVSRLEL